MSFIETASNNFMLVQVTVRRWSGVQQLKQGSAKAAEQANANPEAFRGYVNLLGSHHVDLKQVSAKFAAIRRLKWPVWDDDARIKQRLDVLLARRDYASGQMNTSNSRSAYDKALDALLASGLMAMNENHIWITTKEGRHHV